MQTSYHVQSALSDLSGNGLSASGLLCVRDPPPHSPCPLLGLIPVLALDCVVLISRSKNKGICPGEMLPYLHIAPSPAVSCSFPQQSLVIINNPWLLLPTAHGWLHSQTSYLGHAHQPLYLLGFYSIADCLPPFSHDLFISTLLNNGISLLSLGLLGMGKPVYLTAFMYLNQFLPGLGRCRKRRSTHSERDLRIEKYVSFHKDARDPLWTFCFLLHTSFNVDKSFGHPQD